MRCLLLSFIVFVSFQAIGQVTIDVNTLPEVGDAFDFRTFSDFEGDTTYRATGADLSWTFDDFNLDGDFEEAFAAITPELAASFPEGEISLGLAGFQAAAVRTPTTLEVIGIGGGGLMGFEFNPQRFPDPFVEVQRPLNFGDCFEDRVDLPFVIPADSIPGLDSLEIPVPFVSLDSIRVTSRLFKKETADAWGDLTVLGTNLPVLKVTRMDSFELAIDLGITTFGLFSWLSLEDALALLGGAGGIPVDSLIGPGIGQAMGSVSYSFYTPDTRGAILEFTETEFVPPMGGDPVLFVNGLVSLDVVPTSVSDFDLGPAISLSPNPAMDRLSIATDETSLFQSLQVFDIRGKEVLNRTAYDPREGLDVSTFQSGTYLLVVGTEKGYTSKKFVVASRQ